MGTFIAIANSILTTLSRGIRGFSGLLDEYGGAAAAYSVRRLSSTYEGALIRVREDSGDTEADIGFDANGDLDTTALLAHCGSNNGYVVTWYDQSGNSNDATQTTTSNQPQIVSSGNILVINSKPSIKFDGSGDNLDISTPIDGNFDFTAIHVLNRVSTSNKVLGFAGTTINHPYSPFYFTDNKTYLRWDEGFISGSNAVTGQRLSLGIATNGNGEIRDNGVEIVNTSPSVNSQNLSFNKVGQRNIDFSNASSQELILWRLDYTSDKLDIESNINTYFSIYSPPSGIGNWAIGTTFVIQ